MLYFKNSNFIEMYKLKAHNSSLSLYTIMLLTVMWVVTQAVFKHAYAFQISLSGQILFKKQNIGLYYRHSFLPYVLFNIMFTFFLKKYRQPYFFFLIAAEYLFPCMVYQSPIWCTFRLFPNLCFINNALINIHVHLCFFTIQSSP